MSDNGKESAFPRINPDYDGNWNKEHHMGGLTKREYFAGLAMQGLLMGTHGKDDAILKDFIECVATDAIKCADELLKQLNHDN